MTALTTSDHHKHLRLKAIANWSNHGVLASRDQTPIEKEFLKRVKDAGGSFFRPMPLSFTDDSDFHKEVSYLIDAFDQLPSRPDVAFDSTFKALESTIKRMQSPNNFSHLLRSIVGQSSTLDRVTEILVDNMPVQTAEFLYKRISDNLSDWRLQSSGPKNQVLVRLREARNSSIDALLDALKDRSDDPLTADRRKQAMFLRKALSGSEMTGTLHATFELDSNAKIHLLLSGTLYTARNDRFHGQSFSPFVSSTATIRTYVHPHYLIIATYSCMMALWHDDPSRKILLGGEDVISNLNANLSLALDFFLSNWKR